MKDLTTGNEIVDRMGRVSFESLSVNIVPITWYKSIVNEKTGKPDLIAITILADCVYWYRPTVIRDEFSNEICEYRKKFRGDLLQRDYKQLTDMFGFSKDQARDALIRLEQLHLVKRVIKKVEGLGGNCQNIMYLQINPDEIERISFCSSDDEMIDTGDGGKSQTGGRKNPRGRSEKSEYYRY